MPSDLVIENSGSSALSPVLTTPTTFHYDLHTLAPETRLQIFGLCVDFAVRDRKGKLLAQITPALLDAFRGDPILYAEALEMFRKSNFFTLHSGNRWSLFGMTSRVISTIKKVAIQVDKFHTHWTALPQDTKVTRITNPDPLSVTNETLFLPNVEEVRLVCEEGDNLFYAYFDNYLDGFHNLKKVTIEFPRPLRKTQTYWEKTMSWAIDQGNELFGVSAVLEEVGPAAPGKSRWNWANPHVADRTWVWEAKKGKVLNELKVEHWVGPVINI